MSRLQYKNIGYFFPYTAMYTNALTNSYAVELFFVTDYKNIRSVVLNFGKCNKKVSICNIYKA